jgi:hypothetical protein
MLGPSSWRIGPTRAVANGAEDGRWARRGQTVAGALMRVYAGVRPQSANLPIR